MTSIFRLYPLYYYTTRSVCVIRPMRLLKISKLYLYYSYKHRFEIKSWLKSGYISIFEKNQPSSGIIAINTTTVVPAIPPTRVNLLRTRLEPHPQRHTCLQAYQTGQS